MPGRNQGKLVVLVPECKPSGGLRSSLTAYDLPKDVDGNTAKAKAADRIRDMSLGQFLIN